MSDKLSSTGSPQSAPLLSICIPSYNRGERVRTLVDFLLPTVDSWAGEVELVVSNNKSQDDTASLLADIHGPHFTLHNRTTHLPTAEEHIFASASLCRGTFIWFLGDDDIPFLHTIERLMELLRGNKYDFLFFNSVYADAYAAFLESPFLDMQSKLIEGRFGELAPSLGFISTLAGLSNSVCRSSRLNQQTAREITQVSCIYSHVAWWYFCFNDRPAAVVNCPLVTYRVDSSAAIGSDFRRTATKFDVGDHHFWTLGLIRLFLFMEKRGAITANQIRNIWERRRNGSFFRLLDDVYYQFFRQVILGVLSTEPRNRVSDDDFIECRRWLLRMDPLFLEGMRMVDLIRAAERIPKEDAEARIQWVKTDYDVVFAHRLERQARYAGLTSFYRGFDIFSQAAGYVGISRTSTADRSAILRRLDVTDVESEIIAARNEATVREKIDRILEKEPTGSARGLT